MGLALKIKAATKVKMPTVTAAMIHFVFVWRQAWAFFHLAYARQAPLA